jgi:hypothetical protein
LRNQHLSRLVQAATFMVGAVGVPADRDLFREPLHSALGQFRDAGDQRIPALNKT